MRQTIIIKNMVCPRCLEAVKDIFQGIDLSVIEMQLGKVSIPHPIAADQKLILKERLAQKGFELLDDKQTQLISEIKSIIIQEIHYSKTPSPVNLSTLLTKELPYDYSYLSRLFSSVEGRTIENFVLHQKIEKVKELLTYEELNLSEIAFKMNYSSSAHLSSQFKKVTGMTPTQFRKLQNQNRRSIDEI